MPENQRVFNVRVQTENELEEELDDDEGVVKRVEEEEEEVK